MLCVALLLAFTAAGSAQSEPKESPNAAVEFFGKIGRWLDDTLSSIGSNVKGAKSKIDNFNDEAGQAAKATANATAGVAKEAADAVARLPGTRIVRGHQNCAVAPNGGADCAGAANALCKAKGFSFGKSVDMTAAEECPAAVMLGRREAQPGECRTVTFVTSALCQ